ncbi:hypothetical protein J8J14_20720 [Roseomonas sp. SSH11]|uniref:Uncharacterized protein n=1 Tax=Pararoseomonas baculiformis TaxID=2820812 RepID=A0ABS4ALW4_9PROT|nr:hypothetical protein [Pararoseomonas baculiformis]MBP0447204.1 hypothetical protein [Pararoseomonas baculiformis]
MATKSLPYRSCAARRLAILPLSTLMALPLLLAAPAAADPPLAPARVSPEEPGDAPEKLAETGSLVGNKATSILQRHPGFHSPHLAEGSLRSHAQAANTFSADVIRGSVSAMGELVVPPLSHA